MAVKADVAVETDVVALFKAADRLGPIERSSTMQALSITPRMSRT